MTRTLQTLADGGHFFEDPRWRDGRWYISDFYAHTVQTITPDGTRETIAEVEAHPSGLGWLPGGDLLIVSMQDQRVLRRAGDGTLTVHADLSGMANAALNDMLVHNGHAYVGNFGFDLMGGGTPVATDLFHIAPDGTASVGASDLWFPNGMVISEGRLVVAETIGSRFTSFAIAEDGSLSDRQVWAQVAPAAEPADLMTMLGSITFAPDGITLDSDGHIWAANALGANVSRVTPGGEIVEQVPMPEGLGAYACGLGGDDGRTLLICAAPDFNSAARAAAKEAVLFTTTVDVPLAPDALGAS